MFDVNPLGLTMHLKELERSVAPRIDPVPAAADRPRGFATVPAALTVALNRVRTITASTAASSFLKPLR